MNTDDLRAIAEARTQIGVPENVEATPAQTLELLRIVPTDVAERMILNWRELARQGVDCWIRNHEREVEHWRNRALTAAPTGPAYSDVACHRGKDDHGRVYCVGHGQDWPCAAPTGPDPRTDAAVER